MRKLLAKSGIPEPILAQWEKRFDGRLLPLQYRAIEEYGLLEGASLLISAPTSSGKTFCGEMALARAIQARKKAIYLAPLKAVAEEKYRHFAACYGELGLRIIIATRDHPENDRDVEQGKFDVAVMVYEKFNWLLLANFDLLSQVGTVVVDELHMLADEVRGPQLELALTKLLHSGYGPQIVALSAVVGEATDLARWLGCRLLLEKSRPVELRRGVASAGRFYFRCHNSGERGEEAFGEGDDTVGTLFRNLAEMSAAGRQALVFLKSRRDTMDAARRFIEYADLPPFSENKGFFDTELADEEDSSLLRNLRSALECGVAFHNADLTATQRQAVEEGYRAGLIRVVFATTTLSTGINLPAATVFIEAQKYRQHKYTGRPGLEPLSWAEYESMSGRAGRVGMMETGADAGRAILMASGELEKTILWDYYVDRRPEPIVSQLDRRSPVDIALDVICCGLAARPKEIEEVLSRSYYVQQNKLPFDVHGELFQVLLDGGFLKCTGDEFTATPLGKATAITGLTVDGALHVINAYADGKLGNDDQVIYHLCQSPEGKAIYLPFPTTEARLRLPERYLSFEDHPLVKHLTSLRRELTGEERRRLILTFLMGDWMNGMSAVDIESAYDLHPGMMEKLGRQVGWLLTSAASVLRTYDRFSELPLRLDDLGFSARIGVPIELREIHDWVGDVLFRNELLALFRKGICRVSDLLARGSQAAPEIINSERRLNAIDDRIKKIKEEIMVGSASPLIATTECPESIEIDGTPVRERFLIRINGRTIGLTGKSFKYLVRLVWSRLTKDSGWLYKEDLEKGFNQARYLYRLRQEIGRDFLPDWPLYENNRSGYYRLAADPDDLRVNVDALRSIPDYEIQQMAQDLAALTTA